MEKEEKSQFSLMEEEVLDFWQKNKTFQKSVQRQPLKGSYVFYDGPPFITGTPHYATLLPSIAKDLIPRYWTMKGYRVERVWGWDCHGLPAENKVEKQLGLRNKKDIENLGVSKFVESCREYVSDCSSQWEWYVNRIGRWVDMDNAYRTMDLAFMESVIWAFKELYQKNLIYEGYRTSLHCPRCATPLSKFEITMDAGSYREVEDDSIVVEFKSEKDFSFLVWTTTPWTLPGNLALVVGPEIDYVLIEESGKKYLLAEARVKDFFKESKVLKKFKGKDLENIKYEPVFDLNNQEIKENKNVFQVYSASFVNLEEGTGIVHVAPNFGEDDFNLGQEKELPIVELMDENGIYLESAGHWKGQYFKKANSLVLTELKDKIFFKGRGVHSYPFCYRCETSLIHKTQKAWYLKIEEIRKKLLESGKNINWIPPHFKEGRFKYNLEHAPDWCLSRSRYWGSPVPVWKCQCGEIKVVGSIKELEELSGQKIKDLHRPMIDEVVIQCLECGQEMKRVPEVLDCWFESGSMPFAQFHYPFQRKEEWSDLFPADFIIEYTGQLRGWFYYLHVLGLALFESEAFKNVIVTGVLAGTDGRKMSKSFGNYPDPKILLNKYGSDALRMYFMSSSIMLGGDMNFSENDVRDVLRRNVILAWNVACFYKIFAQNTGKDNSENILDRWIMSRLNQLIGQTTKNLEEYNIPSACQEITSFIDDLSTWYIRRSRERFRNNDSSALATTKHVLIELSKVMAPFMPFISEKIWQEITENKEKSVHLEEWPQAGEINQEVVQEMIKVRKVAELGLAQRDEKKVKIRQPLSSMKVFNCRLEKEYADLIKEELNVKEIEFIDGQETKVEFDFEITRELEMEGLKREMTRAINELRKKEKLGVNDKVVLFYQTESQILKDVFQDQKLREELISSVLAQEIVLKEDLTGEEVSVNSNKIVFSIKKI
jgi:isoleucyl-tRNA synthetase